MGRLSIEVTEAQHQKIKALAALSGLSIKDYILRQTLAGDSTSALRELIDHAETSLAAGKGLTYQNGASLAEDVIARGRERLNQGN